MLTLRDVTAGYGETLVVRGVNLEVPPGRTVALLGRNGVGKTTLLSAIMGLLPLRRGNIILGGREIAAWPPHMRARAGIGYVPQGRGIFPYLTVYENLLVGREAAAGGSGSDRRRASGLDETLAEVLSLFPALKGILSRQAGVLSGGQQQQLAIARALVVRPRLLLLDEPTEGIQPSLVEEMGGLLQTIKRRGDTALLLVEQRLDFALRLADDFYILENGAVAAHGPVEQLDDRAVRTYLAV